MARARELESTDFLPNLSQDETPMSYKNLKLTLVAMPVATVSEREFKTTVEMEAFMQEEIVIRIHPTGDKNAPPVVPVGCNGEQLWLPRGRAISLPRKFVESLTGYEVTFATERARDPNSDEGMVQRTASNQPYPFTVLQDRNPRGRAWLERVMHGG